MAYEKLALANDDCCDEKHVYDDYLSNAQFADCESIDCTQGNDDEQVGHLADGNLLGAVAYDAEHRKKTKCNAGLELYIAEYVDEHEGAYCNEYVCEEELTAFAFRVIEPTYYYHDGYEIDDECQQEFCNVFSVDELVALAFLFYRHSHLLGLAELIVIVDYVNVLATLGNSCLLLCVLGYNCNSSSRVGALNVLCLHEYCRANEQ